jgi:hypothetical protein
VIGPVAPNACVSHDLFGAYIKQSPKLFGTEVVPFAVDTHKNVQETETCSGLSMMTKDHM